MNITSKLKYAPGLTLATVALLATSTASADDLTSDSRRALQQLVAQNPAAAKVKSELPQAFRRSAPKNPTKKIVLMDGELVFLMSTNTTARETAAL